MTTTRSRDLWLACVDLVGVRKVRPSLVADPEHLESYAAGLRAAGHDPQTRRVGALAFVYVDDDRERAYREFEPACMAYFKRFVALLPRTTSAASDRFYADLRAVLGTQIALWESGALSFEQMVEQSPVSHAFLVGEAQASLDWNALDAPAHLARSASNDEGAMRDEPERGCPPLCCG